MQYCVGKGYMLDVLDINIYYVGYMGNQYYDIDCDGYWDCYQGDL